MSQLLNQLSTMSTDKTEGNKTRANPTGESALKSVY